MKLPEGWTHNQHSALLASGVSNPHEVDRPVKCDDCGWEGNQSDLQCSLLTIPDLGERLCAGDPSPAGLCPDLRGPDLVQCSGFTYFNDVVIAYRAKGSPLQQLADATEEEDGTS